MGQRELVAPLTAPATILIFEDDPDIRTALKLILNTVGYTALTVEDGRSALEVLEREPVDLLVLDVMLPDMDGHAIARQVRTGDPSAPPIMMLTALSQPEQVVRGLRSGATEYVKKPFAPEELLLRIERQLQRRQRTHGLTNESNALRDMLHALQTQLDSAHEMTEAEIATRQTLFGNVSQHLQWLRSLADAELRQLAASYERLGVERLRDRIQSLAIVYQAGAQLQSERVPVHELLNTIVRGLKNMYRPWKRVPVTVDGQPMLLPPRLATPLAIIATELLTNAFRHAFPAQRFGEIAVGYGLADEGAHLEIRDNGVGLPADATTLGTGLRAVQELTERLNGTIDIRSGPDGTQITLWLPVPKAAAG